MKKRGQFKLSFGMIFSIILIIFFLAFASYAIIKFIKMQSSVQIAKFVSDLQGDVDKIWQGSQGSQEVEYILPSSIKAVCFVDYNSGSKGKNRDLYDELKFVYYESENLFFYPLTSAAGLESKMIEHLNLEQTTQNDNPFCIENKKGKIKMTVQKKFGEITVTISE